MSTSALQPLGQFQADHLSVRMFDCLVDGATDDTANFQRAMNTCAALGTTLMVPGDHEMMVGAHVWPSGLKLIGMPGARITNNSQASPNAWASGTYALGYKITDGNGNVQQISTAGTTGSSAPAWNIARAGITADGSTVVWTNMGASISQPWIMTPGASSSNLLVRDITFDGGSLAFGFGPWFAATAFALGKSVLDLSGHWQQVTSIGVAPYQSGSVFPASWNITGGTTTDGNLTWTDRGEIAGIAGVGAHMVNLIDVSHVAIRKCCFKNALGRCITGYGLTDVEIDTPNCVNWANGNIAALHFWANEGGAITDLRILDPYLDGRVSLSGCIKLAGIIPFAPPPWAPDTTYSATTNGGAGMYVLDSNSHVQHCIAPSGTGLSGSSAPAWNSSGGTTTDGTVTWQDDGVIGPGGPWYATTLNYPLTNFKVTNPVIYVACSTYQGALGIEFWSPTPNGFSNFSLTGAQVYGSYPAGYGSLFGISVAGSGNQNGVISDFLVVNCPYLSVEVMSSNAVVGPGSIIDSGDISIDASTGTISNLIVQGITNINPVNAGAVISCYCANASGFGPYTLHDVSIGDMQILGVLSGAVGVSMITNDLRTGISKIRYCNMNIVGAAGSTANFGFHSGNTAYDQMTFIGIRCEALEWDARLDAGLTNSRLFLCQAVNCTNAFFDLASIGTSNYAIPGDPVGGGTWAVSTAFPLDFEIVDPNGFLQQVTTPGTSGPTEPSPWNDLTAGTTTDGSITWTCQGQAPSQGAVVASSVSIAGISGPYLTPFGDIQIPSPGRANAFLSNPPTISTPNNIAINNVDFTTALQGGFLSVNSRFSGFPNWTQTSTSTYTRAMFMSLGAGVWGIGFGPAASARGSGPPDTPGIYIYDNLNGTVAVVMQAASIGLGYSGPPSGPVGTLEMAGNFGCNGATAQPPYASGGPISPSAVAATAPTQVTPYGFATAAQFNALIAAVNSLLTLSNNQQAALVANGIMS